MLGIVCSTVLFRPSLVSSAQALNLIDSNSLRCLSKNIYFEARNESTAGQLAVAQTVINRVRSIVFPDTVCEVVEQGPRHGNGVPKRDQCQFSWYCDGRGDDPVKGKSWDKSTKIATIVLLNRRWLFDIVDGATYYHANYVSPRWSRKKEKVVQIDSHIFYR